MGRLQKLLSTALLMIVVASSQSNEQECDTSMRVDAHCSNDSLCSTWYTCNEQDQCKCGNGHNYAVICDTETLRSAVLGCHCVTYDATAKSTFVGSCFYNCINDNDAVHSWLPRNPETLINGSVCTNFHRTGLLCGDCEEEYSPLVLSYNLSCVKCPDGHKNWWKFVLVAYIPLTFFYFLVLMFNINVTSTRLHGVVWYSQALSMPALSRLIMSILNVSAPELLMPTKIIFIFYSFWNLDVLRSVLPDICLNVTTLQALALDYLVAFYPFLLIIISYFIINLHDRKCACVVTAWKPFRKVLTIFHKSYDVHTSVIDSFATFFLLSYVKVLSVTSDLLIPTQIYKLGSNISTFGLYYSPTVSYFGDEHLPYAILALVILTLFVITPTVVFFLYIFQLFHKFLSFFPFNWHILYAFMDSFQGCYKDGTEPGTFDCRWFSAFALLIRILWFAIFSITLSGIAFVYIAILVVIFLIAIINIQPYKKLSVRYPSTDSIFFVFLSLLAIFFLGRELTTKSKTINHIVMTIFGFFFSFLPLFYTIILVTFWLVTSFRKRQVHL